jgi:hypothetical protein
VINQVTTLQASSAGVKPAWSCSLLTIFKPKIPIWVNFLGP